MTPAPDITEKVARPQFIAINLGRGNTAPWAVINTKGPHGDDLVAWGMDHQSAAESVAAKLNAAVCLAISEHLAALEEAGMVVQGWRPIETAPRDGSPILANCGGKINIVKWANHTGGPGVASRVEQPRNWQICGDEEGLLDEGWDAGAGWFMEPGNAPVEWAPLPRRQAMLAARPKDSGK